MTLQQLWNDGVKQLKAAGIEEAELDAKYLLFEVFDLDYVHFLMRKNQAMEEDDAQREAVECYHNMLMKRASRQPLQYLIGSQEFMGLKFKVSEYVLIPRQDTETLVELVLKEHVDTGKRVLDMCTGSGCIAISLAVLGHYDCVVGVDISDEALCIAKENADVLVPSTEDRQRIQFLKSDLYSGFNGLSLDCRRYDIIVSNPPYIPTRLIENLEPEVRDYEPFMALDGKEDGLFFYRRLSGESKLYLKPGGSIYLEIGYDQGKAVGRLLSEAGFDNIEVIKDTPGLDRVVRAVLAGDKEENQEVIHV